MPMIPGLDKDPTEAISPQGVGGFQGGEEAPPPAEDPVMEAIQTVSKLAMSLRDKGNPVPMQAFQAFVESLQGADQPPQPEAPQGEAPEATPPVI